MAGAIHHATVISRAAPEVIDVLHRIIGLPIRAEHEVELSAVGDLFGWVGASGTATLTMLGDGTSGLVEVVQVADAANAGAPGRPTEGITQLAVGVRDLSRVLAEMADVSIAQVRGPVQVRVGAAEATVANVSVGGLQLQLTGID